MNKKLIIGLLIAFAIVLYGFALKLGPVELKTGSASLTSSFTRHASTTQFTLVAGTIYRIAATTTCSARIVTTDTAVSYTVNDQSLTLPQTGHWLAASTTQNFAAEDYGCGVMRVRANAAGILTITEEN